MSSSTDSRIFIYSVLGFFFGIYSFFNGFSKLKQKRLIENTPTSKIRSLAMGLVEVYGEVVPSEGKLLKSPFSQKDCVYYNYIIEECQSSGRNSRWVTVKSGENMAHFYLKDDTGSVLVDSKGARIELLEAFAFNSGLGKDPPESIKQFLSNNGLSFEGFLGINKTMRYSEHIIEPENKLYIMGTAGDNPFVDGGEETNNDAGIMIQKGVNDKTYYISDRQEKVILRELQRNVMLGIYGGGALTVGCFVIILYYLKII